MRRTHLTKIVATLGPASSDPAIIRSLFEAGVDVFRLNFSHGTQEDKVPLIDAIRALEEETGRPIAIMMDLQGPKLRIGTFEDDQVTLQAGAKFRLDMDDTPGTEDRVQLPHKEIFQALHAPTDLLIDDGKIRLRVDDCDGNWADTTVVNGGVISNRKGVNVPGVVLPLSPLTDKDQSDLQFGLNQGVDYVAFIRRLADRIWHVHFKDAWWGHGDGTVGVFGGHTEFGDPRRFWDFRSLGHGDVNFEEIVVALNDIAYQGPLSVEWEDSRMDREHGAAEACAFVKRVDFPPSDIAFDAAFDS